MLSQLFARRSSRWIPSPYSELPSQLMMEDEALRDYGLVAGGLALLLSRCSPALLRGQFRLAQAAHARITEQLKRGEEPYLVPDDLSELAHLIAPYVDQATRDAVRRRLRHGARAARELAPARVR
jgi:hypothetical protein